LPQAFANEVRTIAQLDHPCIVPIYDVGEWENQPFLVMKWMGGGTLAQQLKSSGALAWPTTLAVFDRLAQALQHAHAKGIIHRDLKPENVLFDENGLAFLADFGIARFDDNRSELLPTAVGTMRYTPAEVWNGQKAQVTADVYGLACVLGEMLLARPLFDGANQLEIMNQHRLKGPTLPNTWGAGVPNGLNLILQRALAPNPNLRHPHITALAQAVNKLQPANAPALAAALYQQPTPSQPSIDSQPLRPATSPKPANLSVEASFAKPAQTPSSSPKASGGGGQSIRPATSPKPANLSVEASFAKPAQPPSGSPKPVRPPSKLTPAEPIDRTPIRKERQRPAWLVWLLAIVGSSILLGAAVWLAGRLGAQSGGSVTNLATQPGQAYVLSIAGNVQLSTADSAAHAVASGENIPFSPRTLLKVAKQAKIQLALPGDIGLQAADNTQTELSAATENSTMFDLQNGLLVVSTDSKTRPNSSLTINTRYGNLTYTHTGQPTTFCAQVSAATRQLQLQCLVGSCPLPSGASFAASDGVKIFDGSILPFRDPPPAIAGCTNAAGLAAPLVTVTLAPTLTGFVKTATLPAKDSDSGAVTGNAATSTLAPTNAVLATATRVPPQPVPVTPAPPQPVPPTAPPTAVLPTAVPPTAVPPTAVPPTAVPPTAVPPTAVPPTAVLPTAVPPTAVLPTAVPQPVKVCNPGQWDGCQTHGCAFGNVAYCSDTGTWTCKPDPAKCNAQPPADIPAAPGGGVTTVPAPLPTAPPA
jgi:serine/threonine protein kinase